jgi:membrane protein DedA with SNARE-associated domain
MFPFFLLALISFSKIQNWVTERGYTGGVIIVFLLLFACGMGMPLPEDIPLIIAGAFLCTDTKSWIITGTACWCGIIGGDCVIYMMGRKYGMEISRVPLIGKHLTRERVERVEKLFADYGVGVVGVGRLFAGIRGAVVFVAGAIKFNFWKFLIVEGLAAVISGGHFMLLGHWIGEKLNDPVAQKKIHEFKEIVFFTAGFIACGVFVFVIWRRRNVEKLHDVEEKVATKVIAAERAVAEKIVQVVKKPSGDGDEQPSGDQPLTRPPDGHTVQDQSQP